MNKTIHSEVKTQLDAMIPTRPFAFAALLFLITVALSIPTAKLSAQQSTSDPTWANQLHRWIESHHQADGGYAWDGQSRSHLTPTHAAIGSLRLMGRLLSPARRDSLVTYVRTHHPHELKSSYRETRRYLFDQMQSLAWLDADIKSFETQIGKLTKPVSYPRQYEKNGSPYLPSEAAVLRCLALLELKPPKIETTFKEYFDARRRSNGTYNHTVASDKSGGHVINTWAAISAWHEFEKSTPTSPASPSLIEWLQDCQLANGGFTYSPDAELGGVDDVAYTHAAVQTLALLGAQPRDVAGCQRYLASLWHPSGGFSDRPGWQPNLPATRLALEAAETLGGWRSLPIKKSVNDSGVSPASRVAAIPADLRVFSIQIQAHGKGSVADAVEMARVLRIHLWGAKNASAKWIGRAQARADREQVPVTFFGANEEYGTWVTVPGLGTYSHTSDIMFPADKDAGPSLKDQGVVTWETFRNKRLVPLQKASGRLLWQFGENEEFVRAVMDDSLARGGFAAISTFHFGNPDFINSESFMLRYRGQIPFVALQDAHGPEPWWWSDTMAGYRTVFLAKSPTWEGWLDALKRSRVAAVRHDRVSQNKTWTHAPNDEVQSAIFAQSDRWQWWGESKHPRPLFSLVVLTPEDQDEIGRPKNGTALRLRLAHSNTSRGTPKRPLAELVSVTFNDQKVTTREVILKDPKTDKLIDVYHLGSIEKLTEGQHKITVVVRDLDSRTTKTVTRWITQR